MRIGSKGKYTRQNKQKPRGIGTCDYSGLMVRHSNMIQQYQYRGNGLVWTGFWVNPKFADKPNPQDLVPIIRLDPVPLNHARPDPIVYDNTISTITIDVSGGIDILLTEQQFDNMVIRFIGVLTNNITVFIPNTFNEFYAINLATGGFTLAMQIEGNAAPGLIIPAADPLTNTGPLVSNNFISLNFVYH